MSGTLRIRLFGHLEVANGEPTLARFPTRKAQLLFAYLALNAERFHARETLAYLFWPNSTEHAARKRLRTELWQVRRYLGAGKRDEDVILADNGSVGINPAADVWIDRVELEQKLAPLARTAGALTETEARHCAEAIELYRGHLLEGCYADWCLQAREHFQARLLEAFEKLAAFYQQRRQWRLAIRTCEAALRHEPLAEHLHRELMRCHWSRGNRTAALRQYSRCAAILDKELAVPPMPETAALGQQIRTGRMARPKESPSAPDLLGRPPRAGGR